MKKNLAKMVDVNDPESIEELEEALEKESINHKKQRREAVDSVISWEKGKYIVTFVYEDGDTRKVKTTSLKKARMIANSL